MICSCMHRVQGSKIQVDRLRIEGAAHPRVRERRPPDAPRSREPRGRLAVSGTEAASLNFISCLTKKLGYLCELVLQLYHYCTLPCVGLTTGGTIRPTHSDTDSYTPKCVTALPSANVITNMYMHEMTIKKVRSGASLGLQLRSSRAGTR